jgi:hypothetical protein
LSSPVELIKVSQPIEGLGKSCFLSAFPGELAFEAGPELKRIEDFCFCCYLLTSATIPCWVEHFDDMCFSPSGIARLEFESGSQLTEIQGIKKCFWLHWIEFLSLVKTVKVFNAVCGREHESLSYGLKKTIPGEDSKL